MSDRAATPLWSRIAARIATQGPMTLAEYMAECLLDPDHGYYVSRDPFGTKGDFITAPEISQMFGELLGLSLAQYWLDMGAPDRFTLAEAGPGRGTLMADVLRATARVPGFHAAAQIHLIEASQRLRDIQAQALSQYRVTWVDGLDDLPDQPLLFLANEFFDALPIRQFHREADGWSETMIGLADQTLCFGRSAPRPIGVLAARLKDTLPGDIVEYCPAAPAVMAAIAARILRQGGLALIVDYGGWNSLGDTFQALEDHQPVSPLARPGLADLTAHVDFCALAQAAKPASFRYTTQGEMLKALGIDTRAARLAQAPGVTPGAANDPLRAADRLTHPDEMGMLFKALAIHHPDAPAPAGFPQGSNQNA